MKKVRISIIISLILVFVLVVPTSAVSLSNMNVGIHSSSDGSFETIRLIERLNKMQPYIFPLIDYNDGTSIDPFEQHTAFLPLNIPQYIVFRENPNAPDSTTHLNNIFSLYSYTGYGESDNATVNTVFTPLSFIKDNSTKFTYTYTLGTNSQSSVSSQKEYWHGVTYSVYNGEQLAGFSVNCPSNSNGSNIIYLEGMLETVYSVNDENGIPQYRLSTQYIDDYYLLNPGSRFSITHNLDSSVISQDYIFAITRFTGNVMVRYGNTQTVKVTYEEQVSHDFASVLSYNDSNLVGFTPSEDDYGESGVSIAEFYMQYWARTLSSTITPGQGNLAIGANGVYNVTQYSTVSVNVPQTVTWSGLFDWLFDSMGAFMGFEIAPGWNIGIIMTVIIGLAIAIWALKVFLGG